MLNVNVWDVLVVKSASEERVSGRSAYIGDMCSRCKQDEAIHNSLCYGCAMHDVTKGLFA